MYRLPTRMLGLCAMLALAACGGGGDAPAAPTPAAGPGDVHLDRRIEAFDTGAPARAKSAQAPAQARSAALRTVRLAALERSARAQLQRAAAVDATALGTARQIGVARNLAATASRQDLLAQLHWQAAAGGAQRASVSFGSAGAKGMRLGVLVRKLPAGALLRFYAQAGGAALEVPGAQLLASVQRNLDSGDSSDAARTYWAPDFGGPETTLEVELPAGASLADLDIAVPSLSHFFIHADEADSAAAGKRAGRAKALGESASCNIDLSCRPEYASESRAVARMNFVSGGNTYSCSGTLLNDSASSQTPYFLSAHHCIPAQTIASSLVTDWFYRSSACNSGQENPDSKRLTGGAVLLTASYATDISFMRLNDAPPQGAVYAGSFYGQMQKEWGVAGIHHPAGDLQKISSGAVVGLRKCAGTFGQYNCQPVRNEQDANMLNIKWTRGTTEGGSSGSGLFYSIGGKRYLVGQLLGGDSSCENPEGDNDYGRFDQSFNRHLQKWLLVTGVGSTRE